MKIRAMLNAPWAITPEEFVRIYNLAARLMSQGSPRLSAADGATPSPSQPKGPGYALTGAGTAMIPIVGVIVKNTDEDSEEFGEVGARDIARAILNARKDPEVCSILLNIDSPGGTVDGTEELGRAVMEARTERMKPVFAAADGLMASAAYWVGSAAERVYGLSNSVHVGSIGVITTHMDLSKMLDNFGIKVTHIVAGKYKAVGSPFKPLDRESEDVIQGRLDYLYSLFVNTVAEHRGHSVQDVLDNMADGRIFTGQKAVEAGLIDGIRTRGQVLTELSKRADELERIHNSSALRTGLMRERGLSIQGGVMTQAELEKEKLELKALEDAAFERGKAEGISQVGEKLAAAHSKIIADAKAEAAEQERERIRAVEAQALLGHEELIAKLKFDGKTTGPEAALQVLAAEKGKRERVLANLKGDAPTPVQEAVAPAAPEVEESKLPPEEQAKAKWARDADLRAEFGNNEAAYLAYMRAAAAGRVKVLAKARQ